VNLKTLDGKKRESHEKENIMDDHHRHADPVATGLFHRLA
jgi:hypothetical protein